MPAAVFPGSRRERGHGAVRSKPPRGSTSHARQQAAVAHAIHDTHSPVRVEGDVGSEPIQVDEGTKEQPAVSDGYRGRSENASDERCRGPRRGRRRLPRRACQRPGRRRRRAMGSGDRGRRPRAARRLRRGTAVPPRARACGVVCSRRTSGADGFNWLRRWARPKQGPPTRPRISRPDFSRRENFGWSSCFNPRNLFATNFGARPCEAEGGSIGVRDPWSRRSEPASRDLCAPRARFRAVSVMEHSAGAGAVIAMSL